MNTKKPLMVAALIATMSMGSIGIAQASSRTTHFVSKSPKHFASSNMPKFGLLNPLTSSLAALVKAGTITQAQSDAITAAIVAAQANRPSIGGGAGGGGSDDANEGPDNDGPDIGGMGMGIDFHADLTVITTVLGISAAQLQADFVAGQSLATISSAKTAALITALVAAETTSINAKVTAGTITPAQGATLIAGLTAAVTAAVNAAPGMGNAPGIGHGHHGHHGHHGLGGGVGAPSVNPGSEDSH